MNLVRFGMIVWGTVLAIVVAGVGVVMVAAGPCIDPIRLKDASLILNTPECRAAWSSRAYIVMTDMQTAIGAAIAVLGVAWAGFFKVSGDPL